VYIKKKNLFNITILGFLIIITTLLMPSSSILNTVSAHKQVPKLLAVWHDNTLGNFDIFISKSTDSGKVFSTPKGIINDPGDSLVPAIATQGNNVYVVWEENISGNFEIFMSKSTDGGETFSPPENISNNEGSSVFPQIAVSGDNVYVVWHDGTNTSGTREILMAKSTDGGETFSPPENISNNDGFSLFPQIAAIGSNVYVVWSDDTDGFDRIFMSKSANNGNTFSAPKNVSGKILGDNAHFSFQSSISVHGNKVYVVWHDDPLGKRSIFISKSTDGGKTFGKPNNISERFDFSSKSAVFAERGNVYVAWISDVPNNNDVYASKSTDGGKTFGKAVNISNNHGFSNDASTVQTVMFEPSIISHGNNVYVAWTDGTPGNWEILLAKSTDGGKTFGKPNNISDNAGSSQEPELALLR
jgi:hypothetical protein